jgi:hypothetical protein
MARRQGSFEPITAFRRRICGTFDHDEVSIMSRTTRNMLLAFASLASLCALAPAGASAHFGGGGFGHFGGGPYIVGPDPAPAPVYAPNPPYAGNGGVAHFGRPRSQHASKNKDSDKARDQEAKVQRHRGWHNTDVADKTPAAPVALPASSAALQSPATTGAALSAGPGIAITKCLTKEYRADRSVIFKDNCTQESASTSPMTPLGVPAVAPAPTTAAASAPMAAPAPTVGESVRLAPLTFHDDLPQQMDGP